MEDFQAARNRIVQTTRGNTAVGNVNRGGLQHAWRDVHTGSNIMYQGQKNGDVNVISH